MSEIVIRPAAGADYEAVVRNKAAYEMYRKCGFTEKSINMELL